MGIIVRESSIPGPLAGKLNDLERADVAYRNLGNVGARSWAMTFWTGRRVRA
jgi:hypothetical protein